MTKPNLKHILSGFALLLLIVIHPAKANSDTADALEGIYEMQTIAFSILGDYYMFSGLEGDSRYSREMDAQIKRFENLIGKLSSTGSSATQIDSFGLALVHWQEYKQLIETNRTDFIKQGYANARLVGDLGSKVIELNKSLQNTYEIMIEENKFILSKQIIDTRKMGLIIQTITVEYAARSTANLVMKLDINEGGMVGQAKVFDDLLNKLKESTKSDKQIFKLTDQIGVKWSFINKSVANYNENAVPFIVNTYGDRITQNLQSVGKHFSTQIQAKK